MCGIVWVHGHIGLSERRAFNHMLKLDTVRGAHSTGILSVDSQLDICTVKAKGTPWDLFKTDDYAKWEKGHFNVGDPMCTLLLGHNRYATKGKINKGNAHPFSEGKFHGVHNGTLDDQTLLDDHQQFAVDSRNIYHHMNKNGEKDAIEKLDGAFTLAWVNEGDNSFNIIRNRKRPMHYAVSKDGMTVFGASEIWMLVVALEHANITGYSDIYELPTMQQNKLPLNRAFSPYGKNRDNPIKPTLTDHTEYVWESAYYKERQWLDRIMAKDTTPPKKKGVSLRKPVICDDPHLLCGTFVTFEIIGYANDLEKKMVIQGLMDGELGLKYEWDVIIRTTIEENNTSYLYADEAQELILANTHEWLTGRVVAVQFIADGSQALLIDASSIVENDGELTDEQAQELYDEWVESFDTSYDMLRGYNNEFITRKEWDKATKGGCAACTTNIDDKDDDKCYWADNQTVFCPSCSLDLSTIQNIG